MKLIIDLDDFSEEHMGDKEWKDLLFLKSKYPDLKVNMFTIPARCSWNWLQHIKDNYDWIEMYYHGITHSREESFTEEIDPLFPGVILDQFFQRGFKAPWWKMNQDHADILNNLGFITATNRKNTLIGDRIYQYDKGSELLSDRFYSYFPGIGQYSWHGHVQSQKYCNQSTPNGIGDVLDLFQKHIPKTTMFDFVSDVLPLKLNLGCSVYPMPGFLNYDNWQIWQDHYPEHKIPPHMKNIDLCKFPYPFANNSVHISLLSHTLNQIKEKYYIKIFAELYRIARHGGVVRIIDCNNDYPPYKYPNLHKHAQTSLSIQKIIKYFEKAGFKKTKPLLDSQSYSRFTDHLIDNHPHLKDGQFFIEGVKK